MPNDREKLERLLEGRVTGDFAGMSDVELRAFIVDAERQLATISRPASEHNRHDPEHTRRAATGAQLFFRLVAAQQERRRREAPLIVKG